MDDPGTNIVVAIVIPLLIEIIGGIIVVMVGHELTKPEDQRPPVRPVKVSRRDPASWPFSPAPHELESQTTIGDVYLGIVLRCVSGAAGLSAAFTLRAVAIDNYSSYTTDLIDILWDLVAHSDLFFVVLAVVAIIGGILIDLWIDSSDGVKRAPLLHRLLLATLLGYAGGWIGWLAVAVLILWALWNADSKGKPSEATASRTRIRRP